MLTTLKVVYIVIKANVEVGSMQTNYFQMNKYLFTGSYDLIESYKTIEDHFDDSEWWGKYGIVIPKYNKVWLECPKCQALPKLWVFNNGSYASCKCHNNTYKNMTISVEDINSTLIRCNGSAVEYDSDNLRKAWNSYALQFELLHKVSVARYSNLPTLWLNHPYRLKLV